MKSMCIRANWYERLADLSALFTLRENTLKIVRIHANSNEDLKIDANSCKYERYPFSFLLFRGAGAGERGRSC